MSLTLVSKTETAESGIEPTKTAERLANRAFYEAAFALRDATQKTPYREASEQLFRASCRYWRLWETRVRQLERALRAALASDALSEEQRAQIIRGLYDGRRVTVRDTKTLTADEAAMIERYRAMDPQGRRMLRTLVARLSVASEGTS